MKAYISPNEAERLTGINAQYMRQCIRRGIWNFGDRIPARKTGGKHDRYIIWVSKLEAHIGRKLDEQESL